MISASTMADFGCSVFPKPTPTQPWFTGTVMAKENETWLLPLDPQRHGEYENARYGSLRTTKWWGMKLVLFCPSDPSPVHKQVAYSSMFVAPAHSSVHEKNRQTTATRVDNKETTIISSEVKFSATRTRHTSALSMVEPSNHYLYALQVMQAR